MGLRLSILLLLAVPLQAVAEEPGGAGDVGALEVEVRSEQGRTHQVQVGETLWQIAEATVGDPTLWPALYLANRDQIKDPSRVYPGQELAIPVIDPARAAELRGEAAALTTR